MNIKMNIETVKYGLYKYEIFQEMYDHFFTSKHTS